MKQTIPGRAPAEASASTRFFVPVGLGTSETAANNATVLTIAGVLRTLTMVRSTNPGSGITETVTVSLGGSTIATLVFTDGDLTQSAAGPFACADFAALFFQKVVTGGTPTVGVYTWAFEWEGTNAGEAWCTGAGIGPSTSVQNYANPYGTATVNATRENVEGVIPLTCTVTRLGVRALTSPGGTGTFETSVYKSGTKQDGGGGTPDTRATINAADIFTLSDVALGVSAGDRIAFSSIPTGTPSAATRLVFAFAYTPSVDGESFLSGVVNANWAGATRYLPPTGSNAQLATEADNALTVHAGTAFLLRSLFGAFTAAAGASPRARTLTLYLNGSSTSVTAGIAGTSQVDCSDLVNSQAVTVGNTFSVEQTVTSTPTTARGSIALVQFIAPEVPPAALFQSTYPARIGRPWRAVPSGFRPPGIQ